MGRFPRKPHLRFCDKLVPPSLLVIGVCMGVYCGGSGNHLANLMIIGWWSEFRVAIGLQRKPTVRWAEAIERSGEELGPVPGILVGSSTLRTASSLLLMRFAIVVPREDAWLSAVWENQVQYWPIYYGFFC